MSEETVMKCYQVGDLDYVAATNENEARRVLAEMNGEDPPHAECGCLRQWLVAAKEPIYLVGTEG